MRDKYYSGNKLLSLKDLDKKEPEIYIVTSNRTAGKTTYFNRLLFKRAIEGIDDLQSSARPFMLVYRYGYETSSAAEQFFEDIQGLFFPEWFLTQESTPNLYETIYASKDPEARGKRVGFAVALNKASKLKKWSHVFSKVDSMLFDEFQPEDSQYLPNEIDLMYTLHTSVARGNGKMYRRVPLYLVGNPVTMCNPYYLLFHIPHRLHRNTRYLRGNGWVLEQGFNEEARDAQKVGAFNNAFSDAHITEYGAEGIYLYDDKALIDRPKGHSSYLYTLAVDGHLFGIRWYPVMGYAHVSHKVDPGFPTTVCTTSKDMSAGKVMLERTGFAASTLSRLFKCGCFRFEDIQCKEALISALLIK